MSDLPTGTVTLLLTDLEGSTRLWEQQPEAMRQAIARHDHLIGVCMLSHQGRLVKERGEGDSAFAVFERASDAVASALALQRAFLDEPWPAGAPLRVRVAMHTGEPELRDGDYYGPAVNRCARLRAIAHGGQTLLSSSTEQMVRDALPTDASLRDLGAHRLADLTRPENVFQLVHPALPQDFPPVRSLSALPTNLPVQLTTFVGREDDMAEVKSLLQAARLLTLTGVGGCGKTRLALQVAADVLPEFADGVWLVELGALTDPAVVISAVAAAVGVREEPQRELLDTLCAHLRPRRLLLVLDNCEHLVEASARVADAIVRAAPDVRVVSTSREPLNIPGEVTWRVPSLALPDADRAPTPEALAQFESVRLFVDRARLSQPSFVLTSSTAPAVAQICRRLDGIPLAIELAAPRVKALPVERILERLEDRFRLLTGGGRTTLPRHQTLRATVDWSYSLLGDGERRLFDRLAAFAGGFSLEAAEYTCAGDGLTEGEVFDLLSRLVDKSMVAIEETTDGETRYFLAETLRQYARERLQASGKAEAAQVSDRHAEFFRHLAERAEVEFRGPEEGRWFSVLDREHDNLRAALDWLDASRQVVEALRVAVALWRYWEVRGLLTEGRRRLTLLLALARAPEHEPLRARALHAVANLAYRQGDLVAANALHQEALELWRRLQDNTGIANSLNSLGLVAFQRQEFAMARRQLEESLALKQGLGDKQSVAGTLGNLGNVSYYQGDYERARACYQESLDLSRELGYAQRVAYSLDGLALVAWRQGEYEAARAFCGESLAIEQELGDRIGQIETLELLAMIASGEGLWRRALQVAGAVEAARQAMGSEHRRSAASDFETSIAAARAALGPADAELALAGGRALTLERAAALALRPPGPEAEAPPPAL